MLQVGTKSDLEGSVNSTNLKQVSKLIKAEGMFRVSSKTGDGIRDLFHTAMAKAYEEKFGVEVKTIEPIGREINEEEPW